ncbi:ENTH/VHS family protein isoform X2 [Wolffia australiana]
MGSDFDELILADKLSKLNNTQQCIETLSHWCLLHREKAEVVVRTWDKQFHSAQKDQKVPFLYLANDIIQNSRRRGNEFVAEFWKVLPAALKEVAEVGDDRAKSVVSRLVNIWEERKVFGLKALNLKDSMLGNEPLPVLDLNLKRSRSVRIIKRDSRSVKLKLSVGGAAEKIVSAFHAVLNKHQNEAKELRECQSAVYRVGKMEKDVDLACAIHGKTQRMALDSELQVLQSILKDCVEKLSSVEMSRAALANQLRDALHEQESELESVRTQLQVARAQIDEAENMRRRLNNQPPIPKAVRSPPQKSAAAMAAEIADKLTASSHSQQIMTSVLSSFVATEAKNATLSSPAAAPPSSEAWPIADASFHPHPAVVASPPQQYNSFPPMPHYGMQPSGPAVLIGLPYQYTSLQPQLPPLPPPPSSSVQLGNLARPQLTPMSMSLAPPMPPMPPMSMSAPMPLQPMLPSYRPLSSSGMNFFQHHSQ